MQLPDSDRVPAVMITVEQLVEQLSGVVSRVVAPPSAAGLQIRRVVLPDPGEQPVVGPGDLVVGIGLLAGASAERLLSRIAAGAAALLVRERTAGMLAPDAERLGAALLAVPESVSWIHVTQLISSAVSPGDPGTVAGSPTDDSGRIEGELLRAVLDGGEGAAESAARLGLTGPRFVVVAAAPVGSEDPVASLLPPIRELMVVNLSCHRRVFAAVIDSTVFCVVSMPAGSEHANGPLRDRLHHLAERCRTYLHCDVMVGIGPVVAAASEVPGSREQADRVIRVLRAERRAGVARHDEVASRSLLLEVGDALRGRPSFPTPAIRTLERHDRENRTDYLQTLGAYLGAFGAIDTAAQQLGLHGNTVRYRLRQIRSVMGVDLSDPDERLALMLQLHLLGGRPGAESATV